MRVRIFAAVTLLFACQGCLIAPLPVASPLRVRIVDAGANLPIAGATVIYFVCDIHDFECKHAILVQTASTNTGAVTIHRRWRWGLWIPAPGGLPVPNHFIAIWAPGYSAFVFSEYGDTVERVIERITVIRPDIAEELKSLPAERSSVDPSRTAYKQLVDGTIRLQKIGV